MRKINTIFWISCLILILLPTAAGRIMVDIAGGLLIGLISLTFILAGFSWIGWKMLQARISTCENCGISTFNNVSECPVCGFQSNISESDNGSIPASEATIDIKFEESKEDL